MVAQTRITPDEVQAFPAAREENPCQPGANGMDPLHLTNEICKHGISTRERASEACSNRLRARWQHLRAPHLALQEPIGPPSRLKRRSGLLPHSVPAERSGG